MKWSVRVSALAAAILLSACHGDGNDVVSDGANAFAADVSLVPKPPAPGEVLYAQASELRPLRDGAVWTYRGHEFSTGAVFENKVQHTASATAVAETHTNDAALQISFALSGTGDVNQRGALTLPWPGKALAIDAVELRSPIRLNEQLTIFDAMVEDIGVDLDADRVNDGARVGVYSRVVGNEEITLPGMLPRSALRVDTHVAVALRLSGGGANPAPTTRVMSTWYAPGIGPVRTALRSAEAGREFDREQLLVTWDGITEGLGYFSQGLVFPPGTGALAGTPVPPSLSTLRLDDGLLVLTAAGTGYALHRLDLRGALVSTRLYPASDMFANERGFLRMRSGPRLAVLATAGVELHAITEDGELVGGGPVTRLPADSGNVAVSADGTALWVTSRTSVYRQDNLFGYGYTEYTLWLQRFSEEGVAQTLPLAVGTSTARSTVGGFPSIPSMTVTTSGVLLQWGTYGSAFGWDPGNFAMASNDGTALLSEHYVGYYGGEPNIVSDGSNQWLLSANPNLNTVIEDFYRPIGARIVASGAYALDATNGIDKQTIQALGGEADDAWALWCTARAGHLVSLNFTSDRKFWPEDAENAAWFTLRDLDATALLLSTGAKLVAQVRVPSAGVYTRLTSAAMLFDDRALLLAEKDGHLQTIVVWRR